MKAVPSAVVRVFKAIQAQEVLTLHRSYFRLRKPLERRIYELARKHCGRKGEWRISLAALQRKCGSASTSREFKRLMGTILEQDESPGHIPDYAVRFDGDGVLFINRGAMEKDTARVIDAAPIHLKPDKTFVGFCRKWFEKRGQPS